MLVGVNVFKKIKVRRALVVRLNAQWNFFSGPLSTPVQDILEQRHGYKFLECLLCKSSSFFPPLSNSLLSTCFARTWGTIVDKRDLEPALTQLIVR